jgi:hypothetical protein
VCQNQERSSGRPNKTRQKECGSFLSGRGGGPLAPGTPVRTIPSCARVIASEICFALSAQSLCGRSLPDCRGHGAWIGRSRAVVRWQGVFAPDALPSQSLASEMRLRPLTAAGAGQRRGTQTKELGSMGDGSLPISVQGFLGTPYVPEATLAAVPVSVSLVREAPTPRSPRSNQPHARVSDRTESSALVHSFPRGIPMPLIPSPPPVRDPETFLPSAAFHYFLIIRVLAWFIIPLGDGGSRDGPADENHPADPSLPPAPPFVALGSPAWPTPTQPPAPDSPHTMSLLLRINPPLHCPVLPLSSQPPLSAFSSLSSCPLSFLFVVFVSLPQVLSPFTPSSTAAAAQSSRFPIVRFCFVPTSLTLRSLPHMATPSGDVLRCAS